MALLMTEEQFQAALSKALEQSGQSLSAPPARRGRGPHETEAASV